MYRLSLDLGTTSIGWAVLQLDKDFRPCNFEDMGVRIFSDGRDPQSGASLADKRRLARQARRRRDRLLGRKSRLMNTLIICGLMPESPIERKQLELEDPYALRTKALDAPLESYELGRALLHINQRRGFKSNRKTDKAADDKGVVKSGIKRLYDTLGETGARTLGEFLYQRKKSGSPTRARSEGTGAKLSYPFYPDRSLLEREFDLIREIQAPSHAKVTPEIWEKIRNIIFDQRPLQPVEPGRCSLNPAEPRAPLALPIAQRFRILQDLNHLRVIGPDFKESPIALVHRNKALAHLLTGKDLTFTALRKLIALESDYTFNLEDSIKDRIAGDATAKRLGAKDAFGAAWADFDLETQTRIVELLLNEEDEDALQAILTDEFGLPAANAEKAAAANLPEGYVAHCREVLQKLVAAMEKDIITYADARLLAGYPYKNYTGEIKQNLPYYGIILERHIGRRGDDRDKLEKRYGRIANPTVHVALNQLRRVVNEIIKLYGLPAQIVLEVARDLKNGAQAKKEIAERQRKEKALNDARRKKLEENGIAITSESMLRMRLWEELAEDPAARCCVYTGEHISFARLFGDDVEIEHILPVSRTLDDSPANKTIVLRRANRDKGNRSSPFEAFNRRTGYNWPEILRRAEKLPRNKKWRFAEDAMQQFEENEEFLARHLTDTQYISRVAREYLCAICNPNQVWVTPGKLTSLLAHRWGFPRKDRNNHTHHARDAAIIGVTERALLQRAAKHSAIAGDEGARRFLAGFPEPWPGFRTEVLTRLNAIVISHKADHGIEAALHAETAYGILAPNGQPKNAQHRKPVEAFTKPEHLLDIKEIKLRAELLRDVTERPLTECLELLTRAEGMKVKNNAKQILKEFVNIPDKDFAAAFAQAAQAKNIRRIRIVETEKLIPISDKNGKIYKGLSGSSNAWFDIYMNDKGKWISEVVSSFDANNKKTKFQSEYAEKNYAHIMRLFKNDMIELEQDGLKKIYYVVKLSSNGQITIVEHAEANADKRNSDKRDPFTFWAPVATTLQKMNAKALFVTPAGKVIYKARPGHVAAPCGNKRE